MKYRTEFFLDGTPLELVPNYMWRQVVAYMEPETYKELRHSLTPCTRTRLLEAYIRKDASILCGLEDLTKFVIPVAEETMAEAIAHTRTWTPFAVLDNVYDLASLWEAALDAEDVADMDTLMNDVSGGWIEFFADGAIVWQDGV